jgi:type IV pilus modification protein PilV
MIREAAMISPVQPASRHRRTARGFTLLEALIALLVIAFGMLAIAGFQMTLSRASDFAKQRSEATRLAQEKLEELRAFAQVAAPAVGEPDVFNYTEDVVTSAAAEVFSPTDSSYTSNTAYSRSWVVTTPVVNDPFKTVTVTVAWTDRAGDPRDVTLSSVISRSDPIDIGTLGVGPGSTTVRRPKDRNLDIPYPSVSLAGRRSAFQPPGNSSVFFVFDNNTGNILGKCTGALPSGGATVDLESDECSDDPGYLLSGYIRFCTSNNCGSSGGATDLFSNTFDPTKNLNSTTPITIDFSNQPGGTPEFECFWQRQVTLKSTSSIVADTGQADNQINGRFLTYACVVEPVDHDGDSGTPLRWWGKVSPVTDGTWTLATGNGNFRMCRYTADYDLSSTLTNNEHPLWYRGVTGALDNQNFLVVNGNGTCPADGPTDPVDGDFVNTNTVEHAPNPTLSPLEPASVAADIKMQ